MDDELEPVVLKVRADQAAFRREVEGLRAAMDGPLAAGADAAGRGISAALGRAARQGRVDFEDLAKVAARALGEIAAAALKLDGGGSPAGGGLGGLIAGAIGTLGLPGRATGGMVAPARPYLVGERGPELFVPAAAGRVEPLAAARGPVSITVNVVAPAGGPAPLMAETGRQLARDVRRALQRAG
jgi:hypothetical protein